MTKHTFHTPVVEEVAGPRDTYNPAIFVKQYSQPCFRAVIFLKKRQLCEYDRLKNVSCEYDQLNG